MQAETFSWRLLCPIHTADVTQLSSWVVSAVCIGHYFVNESHRGVLHSLRGSVVDVGSTELQSVICYSKWVTGRAGLRYCGVLSTWQYRCPRRVTSKTATNKFRPTKMHFLADCISAHRGCCALKILHALDWPSLDSAHPKWDGGPPRKKIDRENLKFGLKFNAGPLILGGRKNVQNFSRSLTTFDFDREYLRNDSRYPKSEWNVIDSDSSRVPRRKSGELWSTNKKVFLARIEPPKWTFRRRLHFGS